jgi:hypothetical protein
MPLALQRTAAPSAASLGEKLRQFVQACPPGVKAFVAAAVVRLESGKVSQDVMGRFMGMLFASEYATRSPRPEAVETLAQVLGFDPVMLSAKLEAIRIRLPAGQPPRRLAGGARSQGSPSSSPRRAPERPQQQQWAPPGSPEPWRDDSTAAQPWQGADASDTLAGLQGLEQAPASSLPWWVWALVLAGAWYVVVYQPEDSDDGRALDLDGPVIVLPRRQLPTPVVG